MVSSARGMFATLRRAVLSRSRHLARRSHDLAARLRAAARGPGPAAGPVDAGKPVPSDTPGPAGTPGSAGTPLASGTPGPAGRLFRAGRMALAGAPPGGLGDLAGGSRLVVVVTVVLLNVFTILAGPTLADLLRAKAIAAAAPRVAARPVVRAGTVLPGVPGGGSAPGPEPTAAGLSSALSPVLRDPALGKGVGAVVADPATQRVLFGVNQSTPATPASTTKLVTSAAALTVLGPGARFTTRVVLGSSPGDIVLVGGGDPALAAGHPPASQYPQPATLAGLAASTARALRARHLSRVRLGYDSSLFTGPPLAPGWPDSYVNNGNVTPITALEVDQGRLDPAGKPEDADDPGNPRPRSWNPAADAAGAFASFLSADGVTVAGNPSPARHNAHAAEVARVQSPPLSAIVEWMLGESNNVIAEFLARHVALATGRPATFSGASGAVMATVTRRLGLPAAQIHLVDGSGLSPQDQIAPAALVHIVTLNASPGHPALRSALTGMPVSGFSGTLATGSGLFGNQGSAALGLVRAKTGNLDTVASMAGLADDRDGRLLAFAIMADRIPGAGKLPAAASAIDRFAATLASCGCR